VRATPGARRLAEERDVALAAVTGTGPQGVVTEDDVVAHVDSGADAGDAATRTIADDRELSGMQQTIGERLGESYRNAVHVTVDRSFATGTLRGVTGTMQAGGVDVSLTDVLVSAVGAQLDAQPAFNALYEDGHHRLIEEVNVGVAVDVDDGLVTPVVPRVSTKSVEEVAQVRRDRTDRVLSGEFDMDDLSGGTFTVSNLGPLGVDSFDPIINPPEVAILGVGRVRDDGSMTLCLSFDHRVVNGADAARFLDGLVARLTDTAALLDLFAARVVPAEED
jgi:pyruvate dehydrogenase E2 component (dihydrolipoamide acetyltransferase)